MVSIHIESSCVCLNVFILRYQSCLHHIELRDAYVGYLSVGLDANRDHGFMS